MDSYQNRIEKYSDFIQFQTTYDKSAKFIKKILNEKSIDSQMNILEDGQTDGQTHYSCDGLGIKIINQGPDPSYYIN